MAVRAVLRVRMTPYPPAKSYVKDLVMTWDAPRFTCDYSQPASYRFSMDSILLAKAAVRDFAEREWSPQARVLDLCAGAGVVGLEFAHLEPRAKNFDFVEIQTDYRPSFEENLVKAHALGLTARGHFMNHRELRAPEFAAAYDLVLCNPPYFDPGRGPLPPDALKARSRFFVDASFRDLLETLMFVMKAGAFAYVLTRDQKEHGDDRTRELTRALSGRAELVATEDLRGTSLQILRRL